MLNNNQSIIHNKVIDPSGLYGK